MGSVNLRLALRYWLIMATLAAPSLVGAQGFGPGLEEYLSHSPNPVVEEGHGVDVTSRYAAPLVAYTWTRFCSGQLRNSGYADVATTSAEPWSAGRITISYADTGCKVSVTALIFADGKEAGDQTALTKLHEHRAVDWDEVHRMRQEDILSTKTPLIEWNPAKSVAELQARLAMMTDASDEGGYRRAELQLLIKELQDCLATSASDPERYASRKAKFIKYLQEWDEGLSLPTYPTSRTYWRYTW